MVSNNRLAMLGLGRGQTPASFLEKRPNPKFFLIIAKAVEDTLIRSSDRYYTYTISDKFITAADIADERIAAYPDFGYVRYWPLDGTFAHLSLWQFEAATRGKSNLAVISGYFPPLGGSHELNRMNDTVLLVEGAVASAFITQLQQWGITFEQIEIDKKLTL